MPKSARQNITSNFAMLASYEEQLWRLGALAERYFADDPNTCLLKLRQFAESLAQSLAARAGLLNVQHGAQAGTQSETQYQLIHSLQELGVVPNQRLSIQQTYQSTTSVNNINAEEPRNLSLTLPSLAEQSEIIRRVEAHFAFGDRLKARYSTACALLARIAQARSVPNTKRKKS